MRILLDHKEAALKEGTSFEFVAENRSFTGADGYSLAITFPLRGCPQNIAVFGHIARADVDKSKVVFDCEIHDLHFSLYGTMTIVEVTDVEVKAQFLEGRSVQNYDETFDDIYINELDLGSWPDNGALKSDPTQAWLGRDQGATAVALPWVNNSSGNIQNEVVYENSTYSYASDCSGLSYQPYLLDITKRICNAVGYEFDFNSWEAHASLRHLLICNALPYAWDIPQFARALPHWTVTEYFERLEQFLCAEFDIDHKRRKVTFAFTDDLLAAATPCYIDKVLDEYTADIAEEEENEYVEMANVAYKECDHSLWNYYSCHWYIEGWADSAIEYDTLAELLAANKQYQRVTIRRPSYRESYHQLLYARDVDTYFVLRSVDTEFVEKTGRYYKYNQVLVPQPVNVFGDCITDEDSDNSIELELVPAWIDDTEESKGRCIFLQIDSYSEDESDSSTTTYDEAYYQQIRQPRAANILEKGEQEKKAEYFDVIYLAFWDGSTTNVNELGKLPCPVIDSVTVRDDWTIVLSPMSMRLGPRASARRYTINPKHKYNFKFLADAIPDVRALFHIKGKRYICEKITATFNEQGMSRLLKGVFYPLEN